MDCQNDFLMLLRQSIYYYCCNNRKKYSNCFPLKTKLYWFNDDEYTPSGTVEEYSARVYSDTSPYVGY